MQTNEPRIGMAVKCPKDRGDAPFVGDIEQVGDEVNLNHKGHEYRWILVRHPLGRKSIWPSNRLAVA